MENNKKAKKRVRTKGQKIRSIIMMALLCIAMLSGATYAWFTLSNTARVTNMQLTVGEASGLLISDAENGTFSPSINMFNFSEKKLMPAGTTDGINFLIPHYDEDGKVDKVFSEGTDTAKKLGKDNTENDGHYIEWEFWLKSGVATQVRLSKGEGSGETLKGTYVKRNDGQLDNRCLAALRISLSDGTNTIVYEPYVDFVDEAGTKAETTRDLSYTAVDSTSKQKSNGKFSVPQSKKISLEANRAKKITMRIWIEGSDPQCVNEISASKIMGQLQFITDATNETTTGEVETNS